IILRRLEARPIGGDLEAARVDGYQVIGDAGGSGLGEQALNDHLRLLVRALAEMVVPYTPLRIDEIQRRPIIVVEGAADYRLAVDGNRIVDPQRLNLPADIVDVPFKSEFRRVDTDHDQSLVFVFLRPGTDIRKRAQPIDASVGPEIDENDFSAQA